MPEDQKYNSVFATAKTPDAEVVNLVANVDAICDGESTINRALMMEFAPSVGYTRAYLILKRAWLEAHAPREIKKVTKKSVAAASKKFADAFDYDRHVLGPIVVGMRMDGTLSWGDISVRLTSENGESIAESKVRKAFRSAEGHMKDRGLRIGKGGRFAYDDGSLYTEHRQGEGASVPTTLKGRPVVADLLNGEAPLAEVNLDDVELDVTETA